MTAAAAAVPSASELAELAKLDTPSVCNALEMIDARYRTQFWTQEPLHCAFPELPAMVGYACTATLRSTQPGKPGRDKRLAYYEYLVSVPAPRVVLIQDLDGARAGFGAFWGEVNSTIHKALGCLGVVTNGGVRDLHAVAPGFQFLAARVTPSHAYADVVDFGGEINVSGMVVRSGDLVHADRHGAAVVPAGTVGEVLKAAALIARREAKIMETCRKPGFTVDKLRQVFTEVDQYH
ncbi:MAG: RraA family protein [Alphaproteobacteria bacterium]|nr:RraA family protein [Alphaproteobacteria bacterium]